MFEWQSVEAVEFATLTWVDGFNNRRLLELIGHILPAEARSYAILQEPAMARDSDGTASDEPQGGSLLQKCGQRVPYCRQS